MRNLFLRPFVFAVFALGVWFGCSEETEPSRLDATSVAYDCPASEGDSVTVTLHLGKDTARVRLPNGFDPAERSLDQMHTAEGVRYLGESVLIAEKGGTARVTVDGRTFRGCTRTSPPSVWVRARNRGILFRAVGQEPGWVVEVGPDSIYFSGDYGRRTMSVSRSEMSVDSTAGSVAYRSDRIEVAVRDTLCTDAMSGESFSYNVSVVAWNDTYRGCGRYLN